MDSKLENLLERGVIALERIAEGLYEEGGGTPLLQDIRDALWKLEDEEGRGLGQTLPKAIADVADAISEK